MCCNYCACLVVIVLACGGGELAGQRQAISHVLPRQSHFCAVTFRRAHFWQRRVLRHEYGCVNTELLSAERHALSMVPRAGGAHACCSLLLVQPGDEIVGASDLE